MTGQIKHILVIAEHAQVRRRLTNLLTEGDHFNIVDFGTIQSALIFLKHAQPDLYQVTGISVPL